MHMHTHVADATPALQDGPVGLQDPLRKIIQENGMCYIRIAGTLIPYVCVGMDRFAKKFFFAGPPYSLDYIASLQRQGAYTWLVYCCHCCLLAFVVFGGNSLPDRVESHLPPLFKEGMKVTFPLT